MPTNNSDSPPAEQIDDGEIMRRVRAELENAQTPFLTTTDIDNRLVEIKRDQVRKRLKRLRDQNELASTKQQGYLWWIPEDGELAGEIEPVSTREPEPDWDNTSVEDIPPDLRMEVANEVDLTEEQSLWDQIYDVAFIFFQVAAMIFSPGMLILLADTWSWVPTVPGSIDTAGVFLFGVGLLFAMVGGVVMGVSLILKVLAQKGWIPDHPLGYGNEEILSD